MRFFIQRGHPRDRHSHDYVHQEAKRPMALDVLLQAKATAMPDLAFRYGCRNELCGVCTIEINGQPRLACRARVDEGDCLGPLTSLPVLNDLVVQREHVNKQLLHVSQPVPLTGGESPSPEVSSLSRCIECYACLSGCPMHEQNTGRAPDPDSGFHYGNPYTLLKLQRARLAPGRSDAERAVMLEKAVELGLSACLDCDGCKCQVGISLPAEVIEPLLHDAAGSVPGF